MRRNIAILLLLLGACTQTQTRSLSQVADPSSLTRDNASLVGTVRANAPDDQVRDLIEIIGRGYRGIAMMGYRDPPHFLIAFRPDATLAHRRAVFAKLAQTGYFASLTCESCSATLSTPSPSP